MHREADMIEQQAKQGKQDHNQQPGNNISIIRNKRESWFFRFKFKMRTDFFYYYFFL